MSNAPQSTSGLSEGELTQRLLWMIQPVLLLFTVLFWALNPAVVDTKDLSLPVLVAYVMGIVVAIAAHRKELAQHLDISTSASNDVYRKNRLPEEYYWGHKEQILFAKK